jgi:hypothetical protein
MTPALVKELEELLDADVANQKGEGRVVEMRRLYRDSPAAFVQRYLIPVDFTPDQLQPIFDEKLYVPAEKGPFTLTTR